MALILFYNKYKIIEKKRASVNIVDGKYPAYSYTIHCISDHN